MPLSDVQFAAVLRFSVTAARGLQIANRSLEPMMTQGAKELAALLLGVARTLEAIGPNERSRWEAALHARLEGSLTDLQHSTGEPTFMRRDFLDKLENYSEELPHFGDA